MIVSNLAQRALEAWARRRGIAPGGCRRALVRRYLHAGAPSSARSNLALSALDLPRNLRLVVTRLLSATTLALIL